MYLFVFNSGFFFRQWSNQSKIIIRAYRQSFVKQNIDTPGFFVLIWHDYKFMRFYFNFYSCLCMCVRVCACECICGRMLLVRMFACFVCLFVNLFFVRMFACLVGLSVNFFDVCLSCLCLRV